jgi:hypothetical protein
VNAPKVQKCGNVIVIIFKLWIKLIANDQHGSMILGRQIYKGFSLVLIDVWEWLKNLSNDGFVQMNT